MTLTQQTPAEAIQIGDGYFWILSPDPTHVGANNYTRIFQDPVFWDAVRHTVVFFVVTFVIQTLLGLVISAPLGTGPMVCQGLFGGRPNPAAMAVTPMTTSAA